MSSAQKGPTVFLLGPGTSRGEFQRLAGLYGWSVVQENDGDGQQTAYEQIWVTDDRSTAIHYIEDPAPEERFVVFYGKRTREVAFNLGRSFDVVDSDDVLERARSASTDGDRINAAWQLAVVFKSFEPDAMQLLRAFYDGGSTEVRRAVVRAVGYRGWPEARAFLVEVEKSAPEPELHAQAREIINAWWGDSSGESPDGEK